VTHTTADTIIFMHTEGTYHLYCMPETFHLGSSWRGLKFEIRILCGSILWCYAYIRWEPIFSN